MELQTRFCTSADGTRIAYTTLGAGRPLVIVIGWGFKLETAAEQSEESDWTEHLGRGRLHVRFDRRGIGASQRDVEDISLEAQVADLAAVVDHIGLDQFDLWGAYDGAAVAVAYAAQRPERLARLVLWAPYPQGTDIVSPGQSQSIIELVRQNWSLARRAIADVVYPNGPTELQRWLAGVMRESISPETAAKYLEFQSTVDIADLLPRVKTPTLVLSRRGDRNVPSRAAMGVATLIPDARFVVLEGDIGVPSHGDTSYLESVIEFLDEGRETPPPPGAPGGLVTILFTDMESSTALRRKLGDAKVQELLRAHNDIVRAALSANGGSEIKHTGDGIMASFPTASSALECSIAIQRGIAAHRDEHQDSPLAVYIGLNAGEPIAEDDDLFGTSVDLARRICDHAEPGQILASNVVRELAEGKQFLFGDIGDVVPKGFEQPVRLYEVRWQEKG